MSSVTNPNLSRFYRWLHRQRLPDGARYTQERLAEEAMTGRTHLSQVLTGTRTGAHTWPRLVRVLPKDGLSLLRQCSSWNTVAERAMAKREAAEVAAIRLRKASASLTSPQAKANS